MFKRKHTFTAIETSVQQCTAMHCTTLQLHYRTLQCTEIKYSTTRSSLHSNTRAAARSNAVPCCVTSCGSSEIATVFTELHRAPLQRAQPLTHTIARLADGSHGSLFSTQIIRSDQYWT